MKSIQFVAQMLLVIVFLFVLHVAAVAIEPSITDDFPFDNIKAIYSGPFIQADRSDLLGIEGAGSLLLQSRHGDSGSGALKLALFSFDGSKFQKIWENSELMLKYSFSMGSPKEGMISAATWAAGDFDGDGKYSIISCNVNRMWQYTFVDSIFEKYKRPMKELIQTPDSIWIDQMIACDINADGKDEIVTYNYPDNPDSCCTYHVVIYQIDGDKPADKSLVEIGRGPDRFGGYNGVTYPNHFISKCHIDDIPGEVPVDMGPQSDMSLSSYLAIGKSDSGDYEIKRPFPRPQQMQISKVDRKAVGRQKIPQMDIINGAGPIGGVIFNDDSKVLHYGYFEDYSNPDPSQKLVDDQFSLLENDHWRLLQKDDPAIGGLLTKFTIAPRKTGWLFIKDGNYSFYDRLPVNY
jgi:hypothetical protein